MNLPHIPGYEFEELIGEGGCGAVYRCRFEEREYRAVKVLNGLAVNPGLLSHALTTVANLRDHPGLVPIHTYNLGQAPYFYATNFYAAEGRPATLDSLMGKLKTKDAWRLVEQLIDALAFLHKNDVVHTSVKPGNVFVEVDPADGTYHLRLSDPGQGLVAGLHYYEMGRSGFYASPEQLTNGDFSHGKGKRWDVYSFGVLAYQLLTGSLPRLAVLQRQFDRDSAERTGPAAALHRDEPMQYFEALQQQPHVSWPTKPKNNFEGSLRQVVEQCLELDPSLRPVDLRDVARSFENIRHEADLASMNNRHAARIRGHKIKTRTLFLTTGLFLVTSLLCFAAAFLAFLWYGTATMEAVKIEAKRKADLAAKDASMVDERRELKAAKAAKDTAYEEALRRQREAEEARGFLRNSQQQADRFFDIVMKADDVEFPGFQETRREGMEGALAYFQAFLNKFEGDEGFGLELARTHQFIGEIRKAQGRLTEAVVELTRARDAMDALDLSTNDQPRFIRETALIERGIAEIELWREDSESAATALDASNARFAVLMEREPSDEIAFEMVRNRFQLAEIRLAARMFDGPDGAAAHLEVVADSLMSLRDRDPQSKEKKAMLGRTFTEIGFLFRRKRNLDGARQMQQKAGELFAELIEENPYIDEYQFQLGVSLNQQGEILKDTEMLEDAHALMSKVVSQNPNDHRYRFELAYSYGVLGEIQHDQGQLDEARELNNMSIQILQELVREEPTIERYQFMLAKQNVELAQLLVGKENFTGAAERFDQSIKVFNDLLASESQNDSYLLELGKTLGDAGFAHEKLGDKARARGLYQSAQETWNRFLQIQKDSEVADQALEWLDRQIEHVN